MAKILPGGRGVWVPIDHGVTDFPCEGLENIEQTIRDFKLTHQAFLKGFA